MSLKLINLVCAGRSESIDFNCFSLGRCRYELSDGQIRSEEGAYKDGVDVDGNPVKILVVQGAYTWIAPGKFEQNLIKPN